MERGASVTVCDLPPGHPSFIMRVCGFDSFCICASVIFFESCDCGLEKFVFKGKSALRKNTKELQLKISNDAENETFIEKLSVVTSFSKICKNVRIVSRIGPP